MASPNTTIQVLNHHEQLLDQTIKSLVNERDAVHNARVRIQEGSRSTSSKASFSSPRSFSRPGGAQVTVHQIRAVKKKSKTKPKKTTKRATTQGGPSSMDMARQVLQNEQAELTGAQVVEKIMDTFGVPPAESTKQMLYKRAKANSSFYRTPQGKYGLLAWKSQSVAA